VSMSPLSGQPHSAFNTLMQNQPQYTSPPPEHTLHLPQVGRHPELDAAPSPTDSIPMTVSDIFFRQSVSDDGGSRPVSTGSQLLPPHPPLSGLPTVDESEYSHSQNGSPSPDLLNPQQTSRALANTPFIVQRVLGVNNPVLSSPISHDHTRSGSASNPVSMSGYATPLVRDDDVSPNPGYAPRLGRPR
jgi:hypothetical protein